MIVSLNNQDMYYPKTVFVSSRAYFGVVPVPLPDKILVADFSIAAKTVEFKMISKDVKSSTELR